MELSYNNNNICTKSPKTYKAYKAKYQNNNYKRFDKNDSNIINEKNVIFIQENSSNSRRELNRNSHQNKNADINISNNEAKKLMMNENVKFFINNITNEDNLMANSVNIHNINLINSMNNITFFDLYNGKKVTNLKKDFMLKPINKFNSEKFYKVNSINEANIQNNSSAEYFINNSNNKKNNIMVNKNKILLHQKDKSYINNNSVKRKKNSFNDLYHKMNNSNNFNSITNFNTRNNYSNFNKIKENNKIKILRAGNLKNEEQNQLTLSKNRNNITINKTLNMENFDNKSDYVIFNTFSNSNNSIKKEKNKLNSNCKINLDKSNNRKNAINVNKLAVFKKNSFNNVIDNKIKLNNFKNKTNINLKISPKHTSNIISLLSNTKNKKEKLDLEKTKKIRKNKNMNIDKLYNTINKEYLISSKLENKLSLRDNKKPKSEEKNLQKNSQKKISHKKVQISSSKNECNLNTFGNNLLQRSGLKIKKVYINEIFNSDDKVNKVNKIYNSSNNMKKKKSHYFHSENNTKRQNQNNINEIYVNINRNKDNGKDLEKIEVNKKLTGNKIKVQNHNKKKSIPKDYPDTRNDSLSLLSLNFNSKKSLQESSINKMEQIQSYFKNNDYFYFINKNDEKKRKDDNNLSSNLIYNKKQLSCCIRKNGKSQDIKVVSPYIENKKLNFNELSKYSTDEERKKIKSSKTEKLIKNKIRDKNYLFDEFSYSYNDIDNNLNMNEEKINIINSTYMSKSPSNAIYKKPGRNVLSNSSLLTSKDSFNIKYPLYCNIVKEKEDKSKKYIFTPKVYNRKKKSNIKLNKFLRVNELSNTIINNINKKRTKGEVINNDVEEILPKIKENELIHSVSTYKTIKDYLLNLSVKDTEKNELEGININNANESSFNNNINNKVPCKNKFIKKYYSYYITGAKENKSCFISKSRIGLNKMKIKINKIPLKKECYCTKIRKIFAKIIPKSEICYFNKFSIKNNSKNSKMFSINKYNYNSDEDNKTINHEFSFINKKVNEDINKHKKQFSFASINSEQNNNDTENNYFEMSFGKKINKIDNSNKKKIFNNNRNLVNKLIFLEKNQIDEMEICETGEFNKVLNANDYYNNNIYDNSNDIIKNSINISPSKKKDNDSYLQKTEKGLKLLEKIADKIMTIPFSEKITKSNSKFKHIEEEGNKNSNQNNFKKEQEINKKIIYKRKSTNHKLLNKNKSIKNDCIEILNILTVNNYDIILNELSNILLNNNIITISNISQLLLNQNQFVDIIINKAMKENLYSKLYSKLCKDIFISLMTIIDNYNDDMEIFDKITKDKSLKVILKDKIIEKLNGYFFASEFKFGGDGGPSSNLKLNSKQGLFLSDLKLDFIGLNNFIGELLEVKIISQRNVFEILDLLYRRYNKTNKIFFNDLYLEGIEILLKKMKNIVYEKNNPEHLQHYNKYIKNYLNNIFKDRVKKNNLPSYLYYNILNLIENHLKEEKIKYRQCQNKVKTFLGYKNKTSENIISNIEINNNNSLILIGNKFNNSIYDNKNNITKNKEENLRFNYLETIKKDFDSFIYNSNSEEINNAILSDIISRYGQQVNLKKNIELWEIFYNYIEVCIDIINNKEKVSLGNIFIQNIINNFCTNLSFEDNETFHDKLISLYLNIRDICIDNAYMYQIMGFLLFSLIKNKLFSFKDLNIFLTKESELIKYISKVIIYTIIYANKDSKKFHDNFKMIKLFEGNDNFYNYVTLPLKKDFNLSIN